MKFSFLLFFLVKVIFNKYSHNKWYIDKKNPIDKTGLDWLQGLLEKERIKGAVS